MFPFIGGPWHLKVKSRKELPNNGDNPTVTIKGKPDCVYYKNVFPVGQVVLTFYIVPKISQGNAVLELIKGYATKTKTGL